MGEEGTGMPRDFRRQTAKSGGQHIGQGDHRQQRAGNLAARMRRTREEVLDQKRHHEQERQDHAAKPPRDGRPKEPRGVWKELKEENAGGGQDSAGKKESSAENQ